LAEVSGDDSALPRARAEAGLEEFYNLYIERVRRLIEAPPEPGWDGVWVAERK